MVIPLYMSRRERDDSVPVAARIADSVLLTFLLPEGTGGMGCRQEAVESLSILSVWSGDFLSIYT